MSFQSIARAHGKTFLIWMLVLNWPPLLCLVPSEAVVFICFLPVLFWINIPALWLGIAVLIGKPHYDIQEFGAMPLTPLSWALLVGFWSAVALGLTAARARYMKSKVTKAAIEEGAIRDQKD